METNRQKKIGGVLQKDLAEILQRAAKDGNMGGTLISVTKVHVTSDLSVAKVFVSIFPIKNAEELIEGIRSNQPLIKHELSQRTKNQHIRLPELRLYLNDSLKYIDKIDQSLKRSDNPIEYPDLSDRRKKS